jgi:hypothetical protein
MRDAERYFTYYVRHCDYGDHKENKIQVVPGVITDITLGIPHPSFLIPKKRAAPKNRSGSYSFKNTRDYRSSDSFRAARDARSPSVSFSTFFCTSTMAAWRFAFFFRRVRLLRQLRLCISDPPGSGCAIPGCGGLLC